MTPEELMRPRYKACETLPFSTLKAGDIFLLDKEVNGLPAVQWGEELYTDRDLDSTGLFRPAAWYEGRSLADMTGYVKSQPNGRVYPIEGMSGTKALINGRPATLALYLPATEAEYLAYKNQVK